MVGCFLVGLLKCFIIILFCLICWVLVILVIVWSVIWWSSNCCCVRLRIFWWLEVLFVLVRWSLSIGVMSWVMWVLSLFCWVGKWYIRWCFCWGCIFVRGIFWWSIEGFLSLGGRIFVCLLFWCGFVINWIVCKIFIFEFDI